MVGGSVLTNFAADLWSSVSATEITDDVAAATDDGGWAASPNVGVEWTPGHCVVEASGWLSDSSSFELVCLGYVGSSYVHSSGDEGLCTTVWWCLAYGCCVDGETPLAVVMTVYACDVCGVSGVVTSCDTSE